MSRRRRVWCLLAAVLAMLLGTTGAVPAAAAPAPAAAHAPAAGSGNPAAEVLQELRERGPSCAPGAPGHGAVPAPAVRAGDGHAQLPPGGSVPVAQRPYAPAPVRVHVRGPDRPAPGPVELSVLRV
ncbi:hypothetical protein ABT143_16585 [Streptomyces sp. NPDC002033]|uniref:hypothetical protein n=1 Tax=unclassified Streptomyces TaxID=2593676 RepID=UPI00331B01D2